MCCLHRLDAEKGGITYGEEFNQAYCVGYWQLNDTLRLATSDL